MKLSNIKMPKVSIIIVNRNGEKYLAKCYLSLKKVKEPIFELILVDNNSKDKSINITKKFFPNAKIIQNSINCGFALSNNQGAKIAGGKYLLFLNNDTEVSDVFLKILIAEMENDAKLGVCQPKILLLTDKKRIDAIGSFLTFVGFLYHLGFHRLDCKEYNHSIQILSARGACMLVRKDLFDSIGGFDNDFFAYFEETDLCWRAWLAGYKVSYIPKATIYHLRGGTSSKMETAFIQYHSYKNRICTIIKNLSFKKLFFILPVHIFACIFILLIYLVKGKVSLARAILRALFWNLTHIFKTLQKRDKVQTKMRVVDDGFIWPFIYRSVKLDYYYYLFKGLEDYEDG